MTLSRITLGRLRRTLFAAIALTMSALGATPHAVAGPPPTALTGATAAAAAGNGAYWSESHCQIESGQEVCVTWLFTGQADGDGVRVFREIFRLSDCGGYIGDGNGALNPAENWAWSRTTPQRLTDYYLIPGGVGGCQPPEEAMDLAGPDVGGMEVVLRVHLRLDGPDEDMTFSPDLCRYNAC